MSRCFAAVVAALMLSAWVQADPKVDQLLAQLGDANPDVREEAADRLTMLPPSRRPILETMLKDGRIPADQRPAVEAAIEAIDAKAQREMIRRPQTKASMAWWKLQTIDAYAQFGRKDPKWEQRDLNTLPHFQWANGAAQFYDEDQTQETWNSVTGAINRGCDDPLIGYIHGWAVVQIERKGDLKPLMTAARTIGQSQYTPYMKAMCLATAANYSVSERIEQTEELRKDRKAWIESALALLPEVAKDEQMPHGALMALLGNLGMASHAIEGDRALYFNQAYAILEKAGTPKAVLLSARAEMYSDYAWDARGGGWANTVKEDGWQKFAERLKLAADDAAESWKLDDKIGRTARAMITVCMGQGRPREEMELWFGRAMELNPDDLDACRRKLQYLRPRWHGTHKDQLEFGRECLKSGNFEGGIPMMLIGAHFNIGTDTDDPMKYYRTDPQVWADARAVLLPMMRRHPNSRYVRSRYLWFAATCEKWDEVHRILPQFEGKGEYSYWVFTGKELDELRKKAAEHPPTSRPATQPGR